MSHMSHICTKHRKGEYSQNKSGKFTKHKRKENGTNEEGVLITKYVFYTEQKKKVHKVNIKEVGLQNTKELSNHIRKIVSTYGPLAPGLTSH